MNKEELIIWLNSNSEKSGEEIKNFIFSELNSEHFKNKESWHKHYFLEELISSTSGFPRNVQKIIKEIQKEIDGKPSVGRSILANFVFGIVAIIVWIISTQIIGFIILVVAVLFTKNTNILSSVLSLIKGILPLAGLILGIWTGRRASRWVKNYKRSDKENK
jgi:hypothetical protein